jgi:hypothetical protein
MLCYVMLLCYVTLRSVMQLDRVEGMHAESCNYHYLTYHPAGRHTHIKRFFVSRHFFTCSCRRYLNSFFWSVLGGYFATGQSMAGTMNAFLVGCVDNVVVGSPSQSAGYDEEHHDDGDEPATKYMALCKVNAGAIKRIHREMLWDMTGYSKGSSISIGNVGGNGEDGNTAHTTITQLGQWFRSSSSSVLENYPTNNKKDMPNFISTRSFQRSTHGDMEGWKCQKKDFPDLWIAPEHSFVLTLLAAEIVSSTAMSAGVTLRFPRVTQVRVEGIDGAKHVAQVEDVATLHKLYMERQAETTSHMNHQGSHTPSSNDDMHGIHNTMHSRFLDNTTSAMNTEASGSRPTTGRKRKASKRDVPTLAKASRTTDSDQKRVVRQSAALKGKTFAVLEGTYRWGFGTQVISKLDAQEAQEEGWWEKAQRIHSRSDLIHFIAKHSGTCDVTGNTQTDFVVGGSRDDARVRAYERASIHLASKQTSVDAAAAKSIASRRKTSKKALKNNAPSIIKRVVKWTFVLRAVHLWEREARKVKREQFEDDDDEVEIIEQRSKPIHIPSHSIARTSFLFLGEPRPHDYLTKGTEDGENKRAQGDTDNDSDGIHTESTSEADAATDLLSFKRDLVRIQSQTRTRKNAAALKNQSSGHDDALELEEDEQWVLAGRKQWFRSHRLLKDKMGNVIGGKRLHVDPPPSNKVFYLDSDTAKNDAYSAIAATHGLDSHEGRTACSLASLSPMIRAMGGQISETLNDENNNITHIVCRIMTMNATAQENMVLQWGSPQCNPTTIGAELYQRLQGALGARMRKETGSRTEQTKVLYLVAPAWIRHMWRSDIV